MTMTSARSRTPQRATCRPPQGRRPRWSGFEALVVLRDGSQVGIRPVRVTDATLLLDGFDRLGVASRRLRFLSAKTRLSAQEVRHLTDVDHHDHEALVAIDRGDGRGVGVARFIRSVGDPDAAELAVTVVDEWQSRGLGTALLDRLIVRARQEGVRRFTALVSDANVKVRNLLHSNGGELTVLAAEHETVEYSLELAAGNIFG